MMSRPSVPAPQPSSMYRWVVLIVISLAMFANYYVYDSIAPIADMLKSELGFSDENIGQLYSVYSVAAVIVLLIGGVIIDKIRHRQVDHPLRGDLYCRRDS